MQQYYLVNLKRMKNVIIMGKCVSSIDITSTTQIWNYNNAVRNQYTNRWQKKQFCTCSVPSKTLATILLNIYIHKKLHVFNTCPIKTTG